MEWTGSILIGLLVVLIVYKLRKWANYFSDRNIPYVPGVWPLGSSISLALLRSNYAIEWEKIYKKLEPHKVGGFYVYGKPMLMVRDPEFINRVFTTDYSYFADRGFTVDEKKDPLDGHLFFLNGEKWKYMRSKLSPIFSSGKLKWMFEQMKGSCDKFIEYFDKVVPMGQDTDLNLCFQCLSTEIISSCAFGIEANAVGDPNNKLTEMGKKFFDPSLSDIFKFFARFSAPWILTTLKIRTTSLELTNFFVDLVKQTFNHRLKTGYIRRDFVQLLLELREKGYVELDEKFEEQNEVSPTQLSVAENEGQAEQNRVKEVIALDDSILTAQLFVFFVAGYETTASTLYHTTYLLSQDQATQDKARLEASQVFEKYGDFTYESLKDLKYIDNCISETLRLIPTAAVNFRVCTKDYTFPDGTQIQKGQAVLLPTCAIHADPQYYPEPEKYIPERFEGSIIKGTYSPFGLGPMICIGKRFAEVEMKLVLAKLLLRYRFLPATSKTDLKNWVVGSVVLKLKDQAKVRIERI